MMSNFKVKLVDELTMRALQVSRACMLASKRKQP
jgi:hypothetical protein